MGIDQGTLVFPSEHEEHGKRATILTIGRVLRRFRHALNRFFSIVSWKEGFVETSICTTRVEDMI
jgi:hypothetical protein